MKKINFVAHAQFELVTKNIKKIIFVAHVHAVMETKIFFYTFVTGEINATKTKNGKS